MTNEQDRNEQMFNEAAGVVPETEADQSLDAMIEQNAEREELHRSMTQREWDDFTLAERLGETSVEQARKARQRTEQPQQATQTPAQTSQSKSTIATIDAAEADATAQALGFESYSAMVAEADMNRESEESDDD